MESEKLSVSSFLIFFRERVAQISAKGVGLEWLVRQTDDVRYKIGPLCVVIKASFLVPVLRFAVYVCLACSFLLFVEWVHVMSLAAIARLFRKRPAERFKFEATADELEGAGADFPVVLVQIPIYNEIEVYKISIGAACNLSWPAEKLVIQVLDDSTDLRLKTTRDAYSFDDMIEKECIKWASEGINIRYQIRQGRVGYKARALKEGLKHDYVKDCEYVAIFDADFQPEPDFLHRAMPFLIHNPQIGLIQARWRFDLKPLIRVEMILLLNCLAYLAVNADECFLTRMQEMSLDYQFVIEQEGGSSIHSFFSFNGSGGIWRIAAINEAGGWNDRTTVEDMDLAIRAGLKGWKYVFLGDLEVKSELPSTFMAYRSQQHRWACGPANLFRKMVIEISKNKEVSIWTKFYIIYNFFFVRKIVGTMFTFSFYCVVLPLVSLIPEADVPKWGAILATFIIATINTLVATPSSYEITTEAASKHPAFDEFQLNIKMFEIHSNFLVLRCKTYENKEERSLHLAIPWLLFENVMSFHRSKALFIGLFEAKRANEWVVTEKLGDALIKNKPNPESSSEKEPNQKNRLRERIQPQELLLSLILFACGFYNIFYSADRYYIYLFPQSIFFAIAGFGYFGTIVPSLARNDLYKPLLS
ncbi:cellulose synthase-like protein [Striga asiatica]|uniref:glucomannan 4-beta-mannosyltransferase n=1 Tax=Striga asiatica TaxID=4170 RepID=A0A5A7PQ15_STRAF|nr:cellulose synthase-like protein [Striga asiatica]